MTRRTSSLAFLALTGLILLVACGGHKYHLVPSFSVPAASGNVQVGEERNGNTRIDLKVEHLARPQDLTPPAAAYVVWIEPSGKAAINQGVLKVNSDLNGEFRTVTPYKTFDLLVTAETYPEATVPRGMQVLHQHIERGS